MENKKNVFKFSYAVNRYTRSECFKIYIKRVRQWIVSMPTYVPLSMDIKTIIINVLCAKSRVTRLQKLNIIRLDLRRLQTYLILIMQKF